MDGAIDWLLDHVFLAVPDGAHAERLLVEAGLEFAVHRSHPGQGTANACSLFANAFLELLWCSDPAEVRDERVHPLGLAERAAWPVTGACPIGLCFRAPPREAAGALPFAVWDYRPAYVPAGAALPIVTPPRALCEPLVFIACPSLPAPELPERSRRITRVRVETPHPLSSAVGWFAENGLFSVAQGASYCLELELDGGAQGGSRAFTPRLPLVLRW